jgi:hypothetical protein
VTVGGQTVSALGNNVRVGARVVFLLVLVAACSPTAAPSPSPSPSPGATVTSAPSLAPVVNPTELPAASPTVTPASPPDFGDAPLGAGKYMVEIDGVSVSFSIADDGWMGGSFLPGGLAIFPAGSQVAAGITGSLSFTYFGGQVFTDPCSGDASSTIKRSASSLIASIAANKTVRAAAPAKTTFAGVPATQVDLTADAQPGCGDARIWLWVLPPVGYFSLNPGEAARFIAADVGDHTWVAAIETFGGADQAAFVKSVQPIVDSFAVQ